MVLTANDGPTANRDVHSCLLPTSDETRIVLKKGVLVVQVKGKIKAQIEVELAMLEDPAALEALVMGHEDLDKWLKGKSCQRVVHVPKKATAGGSAEVVILSLVANK
jgi:leucyl-tRNA synthetase